MIEAQKVSKVYSRGVYALRELSLRIDKGEFVFLTGPSGAGKSTLLRLLLRQDVPSEGQLVVGGRNLSTLTANQVQAYRRQLGEIAGQIRRAAKYGQPGLFPRKYCFQEKCRCNSSQKLGDPVAEDF